MAMSYDNAATPPGIFSVLTSSQGYFYYRGILFNDDIYWGMAGVNKYSKANMYLMRYAEVLLLYAETKFLVDNDADGTGLQALNEVRRRSQISELTSMTYQDIKDERRAELWSEGERYFDLVRWGDAATKMKDKGKTWYSFHGYKEGTTEWELSTQPGTGNGWDPKYEFLPYHTTQLAANPNLKQNPGW